MNIEKFTTKFQQALSEAQSLALGKDNQFIEPVHLLASLSACWNLVVNFSIFISYLLLHKILGVIPFMSN